MVETFRTTQKSTIVRSLRLPGPLRAVSAGLARVSPELAAVWTQQIFLTVPRFRKPAREAAWTERAEPIELGADRIDRLGSNVLDERTRKIRGWSWGEGPPVLLVHGWAGRGSQMGAFGAALARRGLRAIALDAPGHGRSSGLQSSLPEMAETLRLAEREFGPFAGYVGHSLGSAALLSAMRGGLRDAPTVLLAAPADLDFFLDQIAHAVGVPREIAELMRNRLERRFRFDWAEHHPVRLARWAGDAPLLVFADADDVEVPSSHGEAIAAARPGGRFVRTIGLGHRRIVYDAGVVERVVEFLAGSQSSSRDRILARDRRAGGRVAADAEGRAPRGRPQEGDAPGDFGESPTRRLSDRVLGGVIEAGHELDEAPDETPSPLAI